MSVFRKAVKTVWIHPCQTPISKNRTRCYILK